MNLREAEYLGWSLLNQHGLVSEGWRFRFDRSYHRFGLCSYTRKIISLSKHLVTLNDESHVRDTILHEIAHALVGPGNGHKRVWKDKAEELGAAPERCYSTVSVTQPSKVVVGQCPRCRVEIQRFRQRKLACKPCMDYLQRTLNKSWNEALEYCTFVWRKL